MNSITMPPSKVEIRYKPVKKRSIFSQLNAFKKIKSGRHDTWEVNSEVYDESEPESDSDSDCEPTALRTKVISAAKDEEESKSHILEQLLFTAVEQQWMPRSDLWNRNLSQEPGSANRQCRAKLRKNSEIS